MSELVREIVELNAGIDGDEDSPLLVVEVEGLARTAGWTQVRLEPHVYITPPDDGFQDFDLVGDRPADPAAEVMTAVEAGWEGPLDDWVIGVRVHAINNMIEDEIFEPWDEADDADDADSEAA
ncbi:hypothetical protein [Sphingopyxis sp. P8]|uniref:hypothetical protein n=1 Tax=Sphingopyxis sp. P8 TaxID=2763256 RepID=UPI001D0A0328|nr:hypothetical protein [Sphingopyxis sp. P8]